MADEEQIGARLVQARESKGRKQIWLANKIDVAQATLSRWERGHRIPDLSYLLQIARALDVSLGVLLGPLYSPQANEKDQAEMQLIHLWRRMGEKDRKMTLGLMERLVKGTGSQDG